MDGPQIIELHSTHEWRDGYGDHFKDKDIISIINELCGSLTYEHTLQLKIDAYESNLLVANNCPGVNGEDITRLNKFSSGSHTESKKGDSIRGVGTRCVFRHCSTAAYPDKIDDDFIENHMINVYSFMISKVSSDINVSVGSEQDDNMLVIKQGGYILYTMDREFSYFVREAPASLVKKFNSVFLTMNTVFVCPYNDVAVELKKQELICGLRVIFNRVDDCSIFVSGDDITRDKPCKLFDKGLSEDTRYIEAKIQVFHGHKHIGKLTVLDSQNVDLCDGYYNLRGYECLDKSPEKWRKEGYVIGGGAKCKWECIIRLHSVDTATNNQVYLDYYGETTKMNGILPYIHTKCLRSTFPSRVMKNNRMHKWMQGIPSDRPTSRGCSVRYDNKETCYENGQYWQAELQETGEYVKKDTIISKEIEKMYSEIKKDGSRTRQYLWCMPFLINHLNKEYIWKKTSEQDHIEADDEEILQQAKDAAKQAKETAEQAVIAQGLAEDKTDEVKGALNETQGKLDDANQLLNDHGINETIEGHHVYAMYDPSRPFYRKTGRTTKGKDELLVQYSSRYFPEPPKILAFITLGDQKGMEAAENHLQNNLIPEYRVIRNDGYPTEWIKFPDNEDWDEDKMNQYCISKINLLKGV
jgi:hypothetical protein